MSSGAGRDMMGEGFRPFGYVLGSRVFGSGTRSRSRALPALIEPELCLVLGEALAGVDVTPEQARAAVRGAAPAFEVIELRCPGVAAPPITRAVADGVGQSADRDRRRNCPSPRFRSA